MIKLYQTNSNWVAEINNDFIDYNNENNFSRKRNIEILYWAAERKIYTENNIEKDITVRRTLQRINLAYAMMKQEFEDKYRESWERYFDHLKEVALIIINELDKPNVEKVLIAILHDSIEDVELTFEEIRRFFWVRVAVWVQAISKMPWEYYLSEDEKNNFEGFKIIENWKYKESIWYKDFEKIWKKRRNEDYFWHLKSFEKMKEHIKSIIVKKYNITFELFTKEQLEIFNTKLDEITQNALDVKFADRIHNLRTQWNPNNIEKVEKKVEETEIFFMDIAKIKNPKAYKELKRLTEDLRKKVIEIIK